MPNTVLVPVYVSQWPGPWACGQAAAPKVDDQAWDVEWGTIGQNTTPKPLCLGGYSGYKAVMIYDPRYQEAACRSASPHSQSQVSTDDVSSDAMPSATSASDGDSYEPQRAHQHGKERARQHATNGTHAGRRKIAAAPESEAVPPPPKPLVEWRRSVGSVGHEEGLCKRCAFYSKGRCRNGDDCTHCHLNHEHRRSRPRRHHEQASLDASTKRADVGDEGGEEWDNAELADSTKVNISKQELVASPQPLEWSPVLPSDAQVDGSLVFGMVTPTLAEKLPEAAAPRGSAAPTSSGPKKDNAFDTIFRGR